MASQSTHIIIYTRIHIALQTKPARKSKIALSRHSKRHFDRGKVIKSLVFDDLPSSPSGEKLKFSNGMKICDDGLFLFFCLTHRSWLYLYNLAHVYVVNTSKCIHIHIPYCKIVCVFILLIFVYHHYIV